MVSLIAMLSSGKGTWGQVSSLINCAKWDKIYLICNDFAYENFDIDSSKALKLKIDEKNSLEMFDKLSNFFKKEIKDFEVAINISSGSGGEHMVLVSAILKSGLGIRFVYAENKELKEFELLNEKYVESEEEEEDEF
ncbi:MAG: hypothetical protein KC589_11070 [Nanoarchaeota archaeon]|nr:hypothetical protein [Nanoarchaeota archaeon]